MIFLSLILLLLSASAVTYTYFLERKFGSITQLIWPILFLFFIIPVSHGMMNAGPSGHSLATINKALGYALLFTLSYAATFLFTATQSFHNKAYIPPNAPVLKQDYQLSLASILFIFGVIFFYGGGLQSTLDSTWQSRSDLGFLAVVIIWLLCFLAGKFCLFTEHKRYAMAGAIALTFVAVAMIFRTRDLIGILIIAIMLYIIIVKKAGFLPLFLAGVAGAVIAIGLRAFRLLGSLRDGLNMQAFQNMNASVWDDLFVNGDLSIYKVYLDIVDMCGTRLLCFEGTIGQQLLSLTGLVSKPDLRFEYYLYDVFHAAGVGGSLHPTAFGVAYGEYALIGGCLFFILFAAFNIFLTRISQGAYFYIIIGFIGHYSIFFARGSLYNGLSVAVIGAIAVLTFQAIRKSQQRAQPC